MTRKTFLSGVLLCATLVPTVTSAEMPASQKPCGFIEHKVVAGDWISKVTKKELGVADDAELFRTIAKLSRVENPDQIFPGETLIIPTCYKDTEQVAEVEGREEVTNPEVAVAPVETELTGFPAQIASAESVEEVPPFETAQAVLDVPNDATVTPTRNSITVLKEGLYKIVVSSQDLAGVRIGVFPALVLTDADDEGRWKRKETITAIKSDDGKNFDIIIPLNKSISVSDTSSVVFDLGEGNITQVSSEDLVQADSVKHGKMKVTTLEKSSYATLHTGFPKRPGFVKKFFRVFVTVGVPVIVGFSTGGPVGAAYPLAQAFVKHKIEKNQRKMAPTLVGQ